MFTHPLRRYAGALAASVLLVALAGCGDDSGGVVDEDALQGALILLDDLPDGYEKSDDDEDDDTTGTCLDEISAFEDRKEAQSEEEASVEFAVSGNQGDSQVSASAESYADEDAVNGAIGSFLEIARGCKMAAATDEDGVTYDLSLTTGDKVTLDGADRQVNVLVDGTISGQGRSFDVRFAFVVASRGNNLAAVGGAEFARKLSGMGAAGLTLEIAQVQLDRVAALD